MKADLNLSNHATEADLKGWTGVNICNLVVISDLAGLKAQVENIDVNKLETFSANMSKLSNAVDNAVVKNCV